MYLVGLCDFQTQIRAQNSLLSGTVAEKQQLVDTMKRENEAAVKKLQVLAILMFLSINEVFFCNNMRNKVE
jgi:hypothetical protein